MKYMVIWTIALPGGGWEEIRIELHEVSNDDMAFFAAASTFAFWVEPQFPGSFGLLYQEEREVARFPCEIKSETNTRAKTPGVSLNERPRGGICRRGVLF